MHTRRRSLVRPRVGRWLALGALAPGLVGVRQAERALLSRWDRGEHAGPPTRPEPRTHVIPTDDGAGLRVLDWGEGPPLVLVHGITCTAEDWLPVLPHLLGAGHRVLAFEQRGHGGSTIGRQGCGPRRLAADLAGVLDGLDVHDAVLAGHSLGGYVALVLSGSQPDLVRRRLAALVLLGAPHRQGLRESATALTVAAPWTPAVLRADPLGAVVTGLGVFGRSPDLAAVDDFRHRSARFSSTARRCYGHNLLAERVTPAFDRIDLPVVVARGSRDQIVTDRRQRDLVRRLPRARSHTFDGAGHALLPERPAEVAALILDVAAGRDGSGPVSPG